MKKLIFLILITLSIHATAQNNFDGLTGMKYIEVDTIDNYLFIWRGDTIDFGELLFRVDSIQDALGNVIITGGDNWGVQAVAHDNTLKGLGTAGDLLKADTTILETIYRSDNKLSDTLNNYYTKEGVDTLSVSHFENDVNYIDSSQLTTITYSKTEIDSIINRYSKNIYTITLPAYTAVSERCINAVEGTDYPDGWILDEDVSDLDISITHNLNRRIADVNVFMVDDGEERILKGNLAYSGYVAKTKDRLVIEGLATIGYPLVIELIFAQ